MAAISDGLLCLPELTLGSTQTGIIIRLGIGCGRMLHRWMIKIRCTHIIHLQNDFIEDKKIVKSDLRGVHRVKRWRQFFKSCQPFLFAAHLLFELPPPASSSWITVRKVSVFSPGYSRTFSGFGYKKKCGNNSEKNGIFSEKKWNLFLLSVLLLWMGCCRREKTIIYPHHLYTGSKFATRRQSKKTH